MENMNIDLPFEVKKILDKISENGFEAYVVGGCVRDSVINKMSQDNTVAKKEPNDWDICTSALPTEILEIFSQEKIIKTGLKHGTVTLVTAENTNYEITTFRSDGEYKDFRHPQKVQFVTSLRADLSRRDFTVNAMAYSPKTGIIDYFGGKEDILNRQIKCVGKAEERFCEDALRIMRALRFSSALGFDIEEKTGTAIKICKEN
ncbi:MAG: polynucleotide adenylyltransferase, partial [Oscillospiraceae bacterium]